jgi:HD-GYP domain-containing protein (c-di-GMP phosphodiesterase class II)
MRDALAQLSRGRERDVIDLVDAIEAKDYYTVGHVHRVGTMAYEVAKQLGLSATQQRDVVLASQMHDVGKIWTPEAILLKPDSLTASEAEVMREHTWRGGDMAARVPALSSVALAVRAHHEHYDGRGYPDGLSGDAIPLAARICAVADAYDAMTSTRPYRHALSHDAAISELRRVRGTQLDPLCVDAFLSAFASQDDAAA